jgi:hypothetical protein
VRAFCRPAILDLSLTGAGPLLIFPPVPDQSGPVAQLGERLVRNEEVDSSILFGSTSFLLVPSRQAIGKEVAFGAAGCDQSTMIFHGQTASDPELAAAGRINSDAAATFARLVAARRLHPDTAVACRGRNDGAGQQAIAIVSAMMLARYAGCHYYHRPFASMAHAEGSREQWAALWEGFLNLGDGEAPLPAGAELVDLSAIVRNPAAYAGRPVVVADRLFHLPYEAAPVGEALRADLRTRYWRSPKDGIAAHHAPRGLTVAVHLRRGDVSPQSYAHLYVPDEMMLRQIGRVRRALAPFGGALTFNLYSEGDAADFRAFADAGCALHVSGDPFETLHNMVTADVLIGSPSNFSYMAGLLSRGIMVDAQRRKVPLKNWIRRNGQRDVPIRRLCRALAQDLSWSARCAYRLRLWRRAFQSDIAVHPAASEPGRNR